MRRINPQCKSTYYLDLAEFIMTGPFSPKPSPAFRASQPEIPENLTPLSRPLYIQIEEGQPSPFFKQLLSKVGCSEVQFLDFTLDGKGEEELQDFEYDQQEIQEQSMSVIAQQQEQASNLDRSELNSKRLLTSQFEYNPEQYIPNMHLLDFEPLHLKIEHFQQTLEVNSSASNEEKRAFICSYLTDDDLEEYEEADLEKLISRVIHNLRLIGTISRLERKAKVSRYLQKKKRRIWRKKINYDCRKKVADNRLRVKGKFVTSEQACNMLGIQPRSQEELKQILKKNQHKMIL